jgi:PHD/YefM family antitoxin component YafN of YafNO toxin-antitoxin module
MKSLTLTEAREKLLKLADEIERRPSTVVEVKKRGRRIMALMSSELYESLLETLEVLSDEGTARELSRAVKEIETGRGIPWRTAKKRLKLEE